MRQKSVIPQSSWTSIAKSLKISLLTFDLSLLFSSFSFLFNLADMQNKKINNLPVLYSSLHFQLQAQKDDRKLLLPGSPLVPLVEDQFRGVLIPSQFQNHMK